MREFRFTNEHSPAQAATVTGLLRGPRLWIPTEKDYPNYNDWLDKSEAQLASGKKRAMAAFMGSRAVGAIIYQQHAEVPTTLEIRNISVNPDARGRYIGAFLLRNSEIEASQDFPGIEEVLVDTKETNAEMIAFLLSQGYSIKEITDLYELDSGRDVVLGKQLSKYTPED